MHLFAPQGQVLKLVGTYFHFCQHRVVLVELLQHFFQRIHSLKRRGSVGLQVVRLIVSIEYLQVYARLALSHRNIHFSTDVATETYLLLGGKLL